MEYKFKNHPTRYKNTLFRSRLEARWAAFFDLVGWKWEYEPLDLEGWTPDFLIHAPVTVTGECLLRISIEPIFVEVKPYLKAAQFADHPLYKFKGLVVGIGLNPDISTGSTWPNICGLLGYDKISSSWAEAGNITRYQPPKEVR